MLVAFFLSALALLVTIIVVLFRAQDYVRAHPEVITGGIPLAYWRCQATLERTIQRYKEIQVTAATTVTWQAVSGRYYTVNNSGLTERREFPESGEYILPWDHIGGVGMRMQPGFKLVEDRRAESAYSVGYSFHLLIVPTSGSTIDILIPTDERQTEAVEFTAHTLALTEQMGKRINLFGFDKVPGSRRPSVR